MKRALVAFSGFALVGVAFGMARYGYGLFLPRFAVTYDLDKSIQGVIGSGSYVGYLVATIIASWSSGRFGPRATLMSGAICAALGTATVAVAPSTLILATGIVIAGASPGIVFPALSDWVSIEASHTDKNRLFAIMNSGTGFGVVVSAGLVVFTTTSTEYAWWLFAGCALCVGALMALLVPDGRTFHNINNTMIDSFRLRDLIAPQAWPLYASAAMAGFVTAIYWTFSVATVTRSLIEVWGVREPALFFWMATGAAGFLGALTGDAVNSRGLGNVLLLTMSAIAVALGILGQCSRVFPLVLLSGITFGVAFIFITGLLGIWGMAIFECRPSAGFGLTFLLFTLGAAAGPTAGGMVADIYGSTIMFNSAALCALLPCLAYWSAANAA